jgi:U2-associated protein SR140
VFYDKVGSNEQGEEWYIFTPHKRVDAWVKGSMRDKKFKSSNAPTSSTHTHTMSDKPDLTSKLNAPKKVSVFEKQRQEAEAKRIREEAENRAALREFEDSFADEDEDDFVAQVAAGRSAYGGSKVADGGGYTRGAPMRSSGPGTLGPPPGPAPLSLKRKRELEQERERERRQRDNRASPEAVVKRPTMLLSSLPRNTTEATIRSWLPKNLKLDDMAFAPSPTGHSLTAVIALTPDTASSDIDSAINTLQQKYLGFGCYLNISKHITISSSVSSVLHTASSAIPVHPFGAKQMPRDPPPSHNFRNAPPPEALPPQLRYQGPAPLVVNVTPPSDLKQLAIINKTVEKLITYGPEWECLLMSQPDVQHGEHWAWLFDNTSQGHVWYRWLVYQYYASQPPAKTGQDAHQWSMMDELARMNNHVRPFDDGPFWIPPPEKLKYEHAQNLADLMSDSGYVSSDLDTDDEDDHIVQNQGVAPEDPNTSRPRYLNPYRKAKLTFFLNHLPDSTGYLCEGDVQAVTDLVIKFSGQGAEEVVDMLVSNLENPFRFSVNYKIDRPKDENDNGEIEDEDNYDPEVDGPRASFGMLGGNDDADIEETAPKETSEMQVDQENNSKPEPSSGKDISGAQLVGLYVISDALAATSVSGVRDAWKYRSLFESALISRQVFEKLGRMPKQYGWGRVRGEQWRSRITVVLDCWERESIFAPESHKRFKDVFLSPPLTNAEQKIKDEQETQEREEELKKRWKNGEAETAAAATSEVMATAPEPAQAVQVQQAVKRQPTRPSAADLILATADGEAPPPKPAPKLSNFSMSLNAAPAASPPVEEVKRGSPAMGFSLGGSSAPSSRLSLGGGTKAAGETVKEKKRESLAVFGDSDSE